MSGNYSRYIRPIFYIVSLVALIALAVREQSTVIDSWRVIRTVPLWRIGAGFGLLLVSVLASSAIYSVLAPRSLRYWRTVAVQTGGLGLNRLLPAGSGALGVSYVYLRTYAVGRAAAGGIVAANNLFGFIGHALLMGIAVAAYPAAFRHFKGLSIGSFGMWLLLAAAVSLLAGILVLAMRRTNLKLFAPLRPLLSKPKRLGLALLFSVVITLCYVAAVLLAAGAVGYQLSLPAGLIVLTFGVAAASAIPVPGGVGAAEAGIFTAMRAYGASSVDALSIALLYRVMTFWLPLLVGGIVFVIIDRKGYLEVNTTRKRSSL